MNLDTGMWGAKIWQRRDLIEGLMRALMVSGQQQVKAQDQFSLADIVWPIAKYDVVRNKCTVFECVRVPQECFGGFWGLNRWPTIRTDAKTSGSSSYRH